MTKHEKAIKFMRDNLGQHEEPWPVPKGKAGSNTGPFVISCQRASWLAGTRYPWCVCAWLRACEIAGFRLPYKGAGAYTLLAWYKQHLPRWVVPLAKAKPGAAIILNIGAGHLAVLEHPYDGGALVHTIDGNWGDAVTRVAHPAAQVRGCVDPVEIGTPPPAKPPVFEVVTSASGHAKLVYVAGARGVQKKLPQLLSRFGGITIRRRKKK